MRPTWTRSPKTASPRRSTTRKPQSCSLRRPSAPGRDITVHYKLDTGMTRIGFPSWEREQTVRRILACAKKPGLKSEGIFTHFAVADVPSGEGYTEMQYERFRGVCEGLAAAGLDLPLRHCANSGAIQTYKQMHCTMTRAALSSTATARTLRCRPCSTSSRR